MGENSERKKQLLKENIYDTLLRTQVSICDSISYALDDSGFIQIETQNLYKLYNFISKDLELIKKISQSIYREFDLKEEDKFKFKNLKFRSATLENRKADKISKFRNRLVNNGALDYLLKEIYIQHQDKIESEKPGELAVFMRDRAGYFQKPSRKRADIIERIKTSFSTGRICYSL